MPAYTMPYLKLIALDKLREGDWDRQPLSDAGGFWIPNIANNGGDVRGLTLSTNHSFKIVNKDGVPCIAAKKNVGGYGAMLAFLATPDCLANFPEFKILYMGMRIMTDTRLVDANIAHAYTGKRSITYKMTLEPDISYYVELGSTIAGTDPTPIVYVNGKEIKGTIVASDPSPLYRIGVDILSDVAPIGGTVYYADPYIHVSHESRATGFLGDIDIRTSDMELVTPGGWSTSSGGSELTPIDAINAKKTDATTPSVQLSKSGAESVIKYDLTKIGADPDFVAACFNLSTYREPSSSYITWAQVGRAYDNSQRNVTTFRVTPADRLSAITVQNISIPIITQGYILESTAQIKPRLIDITVKSIKD